MRTRQGYRLGWAILLLVAAPLWAADVEDQMEKYFEQVASGKDVAAAKKLGESVLLGLGKDADDLNEFAWKILTDDGLKNRDLDLAMRAAKAAYDACAGKDAEIVDTYARALFDTGKVADAITFQKQALEVCKDDKLRGELVDTLKTYEKKLSETPKPDDEKK